jgi:hypothetical protein
LKILTQKIWVWSVRNEHKQLILVDPVDDEEEIVHELILQLTMRSKETERLFTHLDLHYRSSLITFTLALAIEIFILPTYFALDF